MNPIPKFKYTDTALPLGANTVTIFNTVTAFPVASNGGNHWLQMLGIHKILVVLGNSQAGTLKAYRSTDRGATWTQTTASQTVSIPATNDVNTYEYLVESYGDWKLEWTNGGADQTVFYVGVVGIDTRNAST